MRKVRLGESGIEVSEFCLGASLLGRGRLHVSREEAATIIRKALDGGVNCIDAGGALADTTATHDANRKDVYDLVEHALRGVSDDIIMVSRSTGRDYDEMESGLYESLSDLKRDAVDIFLMHGVVDENDLADRAWAWRAIRDFKLAGATQATGISTCTVPGLKAALSSADVEDLQVVLVPFNSIGLGLHSGTIEEAGELLAQLHDKGIGVIATNVLACGFSEQPFEEAVDFAGSKPFVDAVRLDATSSEQVEAALHVFNDEPVPEDLQQKLGPDVNERKLWIFDACTACGECVDVCPEDALSVRGWWHAKTARVDHQKCNLCGRCGPVCPVSCIYII